MKKLLVVLALCGAGFIKGATQAEGTDVLIKNETSDKVSLVIALETVSENVSLKKIELKPGGKDIFKDVLLLGRADVIDQSNRSLFGMNLLPDFKKLKKEEPYIAIQKNERSETVMRLLSWKPRQVEKAEKKDDGSNSELRMAQFEAALAKLNARITDLEGAVEAFRLLLQPGA